ncbi:MAG: hypothetical protein WAQ52_12870 [Terriglobales bacterium]
MIFWKRLLGRGCPHRFSWPRIDTDGRHYQICLVCGTAYEYDWTMMRRTGRLMVMDAQHGMQTISNYSHPSQSMR